MDEAGKEATRTLHTTQTNTLDMQHSRILVLLLLAAGTMLVMQSCSATFGSPTVDHWFEFQPAEEVYEIEQFRDSALGYSTYVLDYEVYIEYTGRFPYFTEYTKYILFDPSESSFGDIRIFDQDQGWQYQIGVTYPDGRFARYDETDFDDGEKGFRHVKTFAIPNLQKGCVVETMRVSRGWRQGERFRNSAGVYNIPLRLGVPARRLLVQFDIDDSRTHHTYLNDEVYGIPMHTYTYTSRESHLRRFERHNVRPLLGDKFAPPNGIAPDIVRMVMKQKEGSGNNWTLSDELQRSLEITKEGRTEEKFTRFVKGQNYDTTLSDRQLVDTVFAGLFDTFTIANNSSYVSEGLLERSKLYSQKSISCEESVLFSFAILQTLGVDVQLGASLSPFRVGYGDTTCVTGGDVIRFIRGVFDGDTVDYIPHLGYSSLTSRPFDMSFQTALVTNDAGAQYYEKLSPSGELESGTTITSKLTVHKEGYVSGNIHYRLAAENLGQLISTFESSDEHSLQDWLEYQIEICGGGWVESYENFRLDYSEAKDTLEISIDVVSKKFPTIPNVGVVFECGSLFAPDPVWSTVIDMHGVRPLMEDQHSYLQVNVELSFPAGWRPTTLPVQYDVVGDTGSKSIALVNTGKKLQFSYEAQLQPFFSLASKLTGVNEVLNKDNVGLPEKIVFSTN